MNGLQNSLLRIVLPFILGSILFMQTFILHFFEHMNFSWTGVLIMIFPVLLIFEITRLITIYIQKRNPTTSNIALALISSMIICQIIIFGLYVPFKLSEIRNGAQDSIGWYHILSIGSQIFFMVLIANAVYQIKFYVKKWQEEAVRAAQLEKENLRAKLDTLKHQISPHFLFNNFNTLYGLIEQQPSKAKTYVKKLAMLYRRILGNKNEEVITLKEELDVLKDYLYLIQVRFGTTIMANIQIDEHLATTYYIPPLTLQLLVENAIKHNYFDEDEPLHIDLIQEEDVIIVKNNRPQKKEVRNSNGVGLKNIKNRYTLLSDQQISILDTEVLFQVDIPLLKISTSNKLVYERSDY